MQCFGMSPFSCDFMRGGFLFVLDKPVDSFYYQ